MSAVLSIQKFSLEIAAGTTTADGTMTGTPATDTSDCIAFLTSRAKTPDGALQTNYYTHVNLNESHSPYARAYRVVSGSTNVMQCEVTVVEFDDTLVAVQTGQFTTGVSVENVTITSLSGGKDDTFLFFNGYGSGSSNTSYAECQWRGEITSDTNLQFTRGDSGGGTTYVRWFLAQAISGSKPWSVQHVDLDMSDSEDSKTLVAGTDFTAVDADRTFLLGSFSVDHDSSSNAESTADTVLDSVTGDITRTRGAHALAMPGFVEIVTFAAGQDGVVYRGTISGTDGDDTESIGATVTPGDCVVQVAGAHGGFTSGAFPGSTAADCGDAHCTITMTSTEINCLHDTGGGESADVSWEVIDWSAAAPAAATRRIILCS